MDQPTIIKVLHAFGQESAKTKRKGWVITHCPLPWRHSGESDNNPSFGVKIDTKKVSRVHCFSCGFSGELMDVVFEMKDKNIEGIDYKEAMHLIALEGEASELAFTDGEYEADVHGAQTYGPSAWNEYWLDSFQPVHESKDAMAYLTNREGGPIPLEVAKAFELQWDTYRRRVGFPIRNFKGHLCGMQGRAIDADVDPKYYQYEHHGDRNPDVWLGEHWVDTSDWVVITESVFDAARVYQSYRNVLTPMSARMAQTKYARIGPVNYALIMFDGDKAGREGAEILSQRMKENGALDVRIIELPDGSDPGSLPAKLIGKYIRMEIERSDPLLL